MNEACAGGMLVYSDPKAGEDGRVMNEACTEGMPMCIYKKIVGVCVMQVHHRGMNKKPETSKRCDRRGRGGEREK